jgi:hypothetical protein
MFCVTMTTSAITQYCPGLCISLSFNVAIHAPQVIPYLHNFMYLKMMLSNAGTLSSELSTKSFVLQASVRALIKRNGMNERSNSMEQSLAWK